MPLPLSPSPILTPQGVLRLDLVAHDFPLDDMLASRLLSQFARGPGHGLLQLATAEAGQILPPALSWWRDFAMRFVAARCVGDAKIPDLRLDDLAAMIDAAPPMQGGEYLRTVVLFNLWQIMAGALEAELGDSGLDLQAFLQTRDSRWHLVGRVHFNLAENHKDAQNPFAFMATYTSTLASHGALRHLPLAQALKDHAGAGNKAQLLKLLSPVQLASERCTWLKEIVDSGDIFHPLRWTARDAMQFLSDVEAMEQAGLVIRMPATWAMNRPSRPSVEATVGTGSPSVVGAQQLLDFQVGVSLDGEPINIDEIASLLASTDGLALLRGKWVEVDAARLQATLDKFRAVEKLSRDGGLPFAHAMRLLAGAEIGPSDGAAPITQWGQVQAGPWLAEALAGCRSPEGLAKTDPGDALKATLRPYQQVGVRWLSLLGQLGLGACLADDMGLGKTIQLLALLLSLPDGENAQPCLLVAPASLLANWAAEAARFTPSLRIVIAHPSFIAPDKLKAMTADSVADADLVVTSYATLLRMDWMMQTQWRLAVLDEAQVIKNPNAKQSKAVKALRSSGRIVLTGTPIENNLRDLWSIFDFLNPGLLGSSKAFASFVKRLADQPHVNYAPLRRLVSPYILRRLKTDKSIIADLPDKTEIKAYCPLSKKQAILYQAAVNELQARLESATDGIARRGLVLSMIMRFKQICNHPSQWLGDDLYAEGDSGKFIRLRDIAETIASRQEKLLLFTQFKEVIAPVERLLGTVFGRPGLVLHGDTPIAKRQTLVKQFQGDERASFFVLSLKAGGAGLNLTAASHVVHFDRWWNPAVENQATDRAFRIGQKRNVLVHKFICRGTVEDRIDQMIDAKRHLAEDFLVKGGEVNLTEMNDRELLALVTLDIDAAMMEG